MDVLSEIMFPMKTTTPVKKGIASAGLTTTPCTYKELAAFEGSTMEATR
jgi:hypothetical protein